MSDGKWGPVALFIGGLRPLPPEGQQTGMYKERQSAPVMCGLLGLAGDMQGDTRVHGGPDKAVHLYPAGHYTRLVAALPAMEVTPGPGTLGENLSVDGLDETQVCVGDVFALGAVRLQVSQPRRPCWKISARLGVERASQVVAEGGLTGWYFRVLEGGQMPADGELALLERPSPQATLSRLWAIEQGHRPGLDEMRALAGTPALAEGWATRLRQRADWLERNV